MPQTETAREVQSSASALLVSEYFNCAIYMLGMFGVKRIDCRKVTISGPHKYAQYDDGIQVRYLEVKKRNEVARMLTGLDRFLVVLPLSVAIAVDDPMEATGSGSKRSRYTSCDPRYELEFNEKLFAANLAPLFDVRTPTGQVRERCEVWAKRHGGGG